MTILYSQVLLNKTSDRSHDCGEVTVPTDNQSEVQETKAKECKYSHADICKPSFLLSPCKLCTVLRQVEQLNKHGGGGGGVKRKGVLCNYFKACIRSRPLHYESYSGMSGSCLLRKSPERGKRSRMIDLTAAGFKRSPSNQQWHMEEHYFKNS